VLFAFNEEQPMRTVVAACILTLACAASGAQSLGDPDSFGNHVTYLGLADSGDVSLRTKCPVVVPAGSQCIEVSTQPSSTVLPAIVVGTIDLPAGVTQSAACCRTRR
jgi:hypothetical protein